MDIIDLAEGGEEGDGDRGGAGEAADRQGAFDNAADANLEPMVPGQDEGGAAQVVGPVVLLTGRSLRDVPLGPLGELEGHHFDDAVLLGGEGDVDAFVDGEAGDFAEVVVGMGANWADAVGAEGFCFWISAVNLSKLNFAIHFCWFEMPD